MPLVEFLFSRFPAKRFCQTVVVTRYAQVAATAQRCGFQVVENPDTTGDLSLTIHLGLNALDRWLDGCLFSVCDQPLLCAQSIHALTDRFCSEPDTIVALGYHGRRGNPVIFPRSLFSALSALSPHQSGGVVISQHAHLLRVVEATHPWELLDIDSPADLGYLEQLWGSEPSY